MNQGEIYPIEVEVTKYNVFASVELNLSNECLSSIIHNENCVYTDINGLMRFSCTSHLTLIIWNGETHRNGISVSI